jgi:DNA-binding MarR family transcriptional regulator
MVTQKGIQSALDCDLGYLSRLLKKNQKKGYIRREKVRSKDKFRILNGFFLTQRGEKVALKFNEIVNNHE